MWLERWHFVFPLLLFAGLYAIGGMSWLVWGGFVRSVFVLHSTWLVNSASHVWGYRSHSTRDRSTNLWWVALFTYGEGWHNNHHAYQTSARHGLRWWEIDMTYIVDPGHEIVPYRLQHPLAENPHEHGRNRLAVGGFIKLNPVAPSVACLLFGLPVKMSVPSSKAALAQRQSRGLI